MMRTLDGPDASGRLRVCRDVLQLNPLARIASNGAGVNRRAVRCPTRDCDEMLVTFVG
jgi:hypothetical protein